MNDSNIRKNLVTASAVLCVAGSLQGCSSGGDSPSDLFTWLAKGGNGGADGGTGGDGGSFTIDKNGTGDILTTNAGETSATFSPRDIAGITKNLGSNPVMITSDTTITAIPMGMPRPTAAGTPYMIMDGSFNFLYKSPGSGNVDGTQDRVTGLEVGEAVKLILGLNNNAVNPTEVRLSFANDICNYGEITTENDSLMNRGHLNLFGGRYIGTGNVTTFGIDDGQRGGSINIFGDFAAYNSGAFMAYGADSTAPATIAGNGGSINLGAGFEVQNTGAFSSYGGAATDGEGGSGFSISLQADGDTFNSGAFDSHGGNGVGNGRTGGSITILSTEFGAVKNTGAIMTYGGHVTGDLSLNGGSGGNVFMSAGAGGIWQNAAIMTNGGNTEGLTANGGNGGNVDIRGAEHNFAGADDDRAPGDISISGNIDTSGGSALATGTGNGGNAGALDLEFLDGSGDKPQDRRMVAFRGYNLFNACGGDGNYGGNGGFFDTSINGEVAFNSVRYAAGNNTNRIPVDAIGGNVVAGATTLPYLAGNGGGFTLETPFEMGFVVENMAALNNAAVNLSSGTGTMDAAGGDNPGNGGTFDMFGYNSAQNTGAFTSNGTSDSSTDGLLTGVGGSGGSLNLSTEMGAATNSGEASVNGGDGEFIGGDAGYIGIFGFTGATNGANITGNGGNADPTLAGSMGGDGAYVELFTGANGNASSSGTLTNERGVGETNGIGGALATNGSCTGDGC